MANKVFNMAGGKHSAAAYSAFENAMYGSCVASDSDFVATAGTGMNVSLSKGNGLIDTGLEYARRIQSDATQTIAISAASSANPRKDAIVAYIDNSVAPSTSYTDNTNNILKFTSVDGTPAANPSAPSAATIQTAVGAGNPYVVLWHVLVPKSATSLTAATFTRACRVANLTDTANIRDGGVTKAKLASAAVDNSKLDYSALYISATPLAGNKSTNANTKTEIQSLTLPAGKWRVTYLIRGFYSGSNPLVDSFLNDGSSDLIELAINAGFSGSDARFEVIATKEITLSGTKTLKSMITTPSAATVSPTSDLFAFRAA